MGQRSLAGNVSARRLERAKLREAASRIPSPRHGASILAAAFFDGIPEYLRVLAKPYVDIVQKGESLVRERATTQTLSMDALDYINGCFFHPETCASMRASLVPSRER